MLLSKPGPFQRGSIFSSRKISHFIDRDFQLRYMIMVFLAIFIGSIAGLIPLYYFLDDNYQIFFNLAENQTPSMLDHLEREKLWLEMVVLGGALVNLVFFSFISFKLTSRVVGPLQVLKNHLRLLSRGYWSQEPLKTRDQDEFKDLIESYNYFFMLLKTQYEREQALLKKIQVDPSNSDAFEAYQELLRMRSLHLDRDPQEEKELAS